MILPFPSVQFFFFNIYLFILQHWVLIAAYGISVVVILTCRFSCPFCDLSSQTRDQTSISCNAKQTQLSDHQRSPSVTHFKIEYVPQKNHSLT